MTFGPPVCDLITSSPVYQPPSLNHQHIKEDMLRICQLKHMQFSSNDLKMAPIESKIVSNHHKEIYMENFCGRTCNEQAIHYKDEGYLKWEPTRFGRIQTLTNFTILSVNLVDQSLTLSSQALVLSPSKPNITYKSANQRVSSGSLFEWFGHFAERPPKLQIITN